MNIRKRFLRMKQDEHEIQRRMDSIGLYSVDCILVCIHSHMEKFTISIYRQSKNDYKTIEKHDVVFLVDTTIDEEKADSIINMILEEINKEEWVN